MKPLISIGSTRTNLYTNPIPRSPQSSIQTTVGNTQKSSSIELNLTEVPKEQIDFVRNNLQILMRAVSSSLHLCSAKFSFEELYRSGFQLGNRGFGVLVHDHLKKQVEVYCDAFVMPDFCERGEDGNWIVKDSSNEVLLELLVKRWRDFQGSSFLVREFFMIAAHSSPTIALQVTSVAPFLFVTKSSFTVPCQIESLPFSSITFTEIALANLLQKDKFTQSQQCWVTWALKKTYRVVLETPFLQQTRQYLSQKAEEFIQTSTMSDYLSFVYHLSKLELDRLSSFLLEHSRPHLEQTIRESLLLFHLDRLIESETGFVFMLKKGIESSLKLFYDLVKFSSEVIERLRKRFYTWMLEEGKSHMNQTNSTINPVQFIEYIVEFKAKCEKLIVRCFESNKQYRDSVQDAFKVFINVNDGTRISEYLSHYMDSILKKGPKSFSDDEITDKIRQAMEIFKFISDKDTFESYYKRHLSVRLLNELSTSEENEKKFISELKKEMGVQYTSKIERMFHDMRVSSELVTEFIANPVSQSIDRDFEFGVKVLTLGAWPQILSTDYHIPESFQICKTSFEAFYSAKHSGKKLRWMYLNGSSTLIARHPGGRITDLSVTPFQSILLTLFNEQDSLTVAQIEAALNAKKQDFQRHLLALIHSKHPILLGNPNSIKDEDVFSWNPKFKSSSRRVKIGLGLLKESNEESVKTRQSIEGDRKPQVEASIVRIMKARKIMEHQQLVAEVMQQLTSFKPDPKFIKVRIEDLIEREYLRRSDDKTGVYEYIS